MNEIALVNEMLAYLLLIFGGWAFLYKSAISRLWWPLVAPILEPLGFRLVVMDMSFGIYAIRYMPGDDR